MHTKQKEKGKKQTYVNTLFPCRTRWAHTDTLWRRCPTARGRRCIWNYTWLRSCRHHCHNSCNRCQVQTAGCNGALKNTTEAENMRSRAEGTAATGLMLMTFCCQGCLGAGQIKWKQDIRYTVCPLFWCSSQTFVQEHVDSAWVIKNAPSLRHVFEAHLAPWQWSDRILCSPLGQTLCRTAYATPLGSWTLKVSLSEQHWKRRGPFRGAYLGWIETNRLKKEAEMELTLSGCHLQCLHPRVCPRSPSLSVFLVLPIYPSD